MLAWRHIKREAVIYYNILNTHCLLHCVYCVYTKFPLTETERGTLEPTWHTSDRPELQTPTECWIEQLAGWLWWQAGKWQQCWQAQINPWSTALAANCTRNQSKTHTNPVQGQKEKMSKLVSETRKRLKERGHGRKQPKWGNTFQHIHYIINYYS